MRNCTAPQAGTCSFVQVCEIREMEEKHRLRRPADHSMGWYMCVLTARSIRLGHVCENVILRQEKIEFGVSIVKENPYSSPGDVNAANQSYRGIGVTLLKVFLGGCIVVLLIVLFVPVRRNARGAAYRTHCRNNLKHIALALSNYEDANGALPPLYTVDANGRRLHSWRTLVLPFLDRKELYDTIDLSKPWDDPSNAAAYETSLDIFRCRSSGIPPNHTTYLGVAGEDGVFRPTETTYYSEVAEGDSGTLMVIEVSPDDSIHWMAPQDQAGQFVRDFGPNTELAHENGTQAAFSDGSVRFLSERTSDEERLAMTSNSHDLATSDTKEADGTLD
ncbi:MAG: DUF1559 domain-containing protein [Fuerstiella sp.]|nr:DUF1559 domain-containing protein [Fuerstiella sp.]